LGVSGHGDPQPCGCLTPATKDASRYPGQGERTVPGAPADFAAQHVAFSPPGATAGHGVVSCPRPRALSEGSTRPAPSGRPQPLSRLEPALTGGADAVKSSRSDRCRILPTELSRDLAGAAAGPGRANGRPADPAPLPHRIRDAAHCRRLPGRRRRGRPAGLLGSLSDFRRGRWTGRKNRQHARVADIETQPHSPTKAWHPPADAVENQAVMCGRQSSPRAPSPRDRAVKAAGADRPPEQGAGGCSLHGARAAGRAAAPGRHGNCARRDRPREQRAARRRPTRRAAQGAPRTKRDGIWRAAGRPRRGAERPGPGPRQPRTGLPQHRDGPQHRDCPQHRELAGGRADRVFPAHRGPKLGQPVRRQALAEGGSPAQSPALDQPPRSPARQAGAAGAMKERMRHRGGVSQGTRPARAAGRQARAAAAEFGQEKNRFQGRARRPLVPQPRRGGAGRYHAAIMRPRPLACKSAQAGDDAQARPPPSILAPTPLQGARSGLS